MRNIIHYRKRIYDEIIKYKSIGSFNDDRRLYLREIFASRMKQPGANRMKKRKKGGGEKRNARRAAAEKPREEKEEEREIK